MLTSMILNRYSAVRRQGEPGPDGRETKILDFQTQQEKLFPPLAMCIGFHIAATSVWERYNTIQNEIEQGEYDNLPELHAISCSIKVVVTSEAAQAADQLRRACGGHGFMSSSNLPGIFGLITASCTYEGENTVLLLQIARYLVKVSLGTERKSYNSKNRNLKTNKRPKKDQPKLIQQMNQGERPNKTRKKEKKKKIDKQ